MLEKELRKKLAKKNKLVAYCMSLDIPLIFNHNMDFKNQKVSMSGGFITILLWILCEGRVYIHIYKTT